MTTKPYRRYPFLTHRSEFGRKSVLLFLLFSDLTDFDQLIELRTEKCDILGKFQFVVSNLISFLSLLTSNPVIFESSNFSKMIKNFRENSDVFFHVVSKSANDYRADVFLTLTFSTALGVLIYLSTFSHCI